MKLRQKRCRRKRNRGVEKRCIFAREEHRRYRKKFGWGGDQNSIWKRGRRVWGTKEKHSS